MYERLDPEGVKKQKERKLFKFQSFYKFTFLKQIKKMITGDKISNRLRNEPNIQEYWNYNQFQNQFQKLYLCGHRRDIWLSMATKR